MAEAAGMKMVNGRVSSSSAEAAARVLGSSGLTISAFIRNSLEHVATSGQVPATGFPVDSSYPDAERVKALVSQLESMPMPGRQDSADLGEDDMVERIRMQRYGY